MFEKKFFFVCLFFFLATPGPKSLCQKDFCSYIWLQYSNVIKECWNTSLLCITVWHFILVDISSQIGEKYVVDMEGRI